MTMASHEPIDLTAVDHDIRGLRIVPSDDGFVVHCPCGWASRPRPRTSDAAVEWQRHRDGAG